MTAPSVSGQPRRGFFSSNNKKSQVKNGEQCEFKSLAKQMVDALSEDQREHAARSSFKYLWKAVHTKGTTKELKEQQEYYAMKMAMRHVKSKKGNLAVALEKLKSAIQFRIDNDLDGLRLCFHGDTLDLDNETKQRYQTYRENLLDRMTSRRVYVCGFDKNGRAIYTIFAARTKDFDHEWFLKESLYNFERALACTERESGGVEESITVIGNYTGFTNKHAAPMSLSHEFMNCLRQNYPGRVKQVFLLNTPTSFYVFWSLLKPFIGTDTRKKIQFLSDRHREGTFSKIISVDQASPWMMEGGQKVKDFDCVEYLTQLGFDEAFD